MKSIMRWVLKVALLAILSLAIAGGVKSVLATVVIFLVLVGVSIFTNFSRQTAAGQRSQGQWDEYRYWTLANLIYFVMTVYLFWYLSPLYWDAYGGPDPSFHWGLSDLRPTQAEYDRHPVYYSFRFSVPYVLAGIVLTFLGLQASPWLVVRSKISAKIESVSAALVALLLMLCIAAALDIGVRYKALNGPIIFSEPGYTFQILLASFAPLCVLTGLFVSGKPRHSIGLHGDLGHIPQRTRTI
jgi:hypothetical protein